jgi:cytoskeletal protein CcmA (bactofilin family)
MGIFGSRRQPEPEPQEVPERIPHPPQPAPAPQPIGFETVLGASTSLEGKFSSNSNVRIDGTFSGSLEINGNVLVGETARINADIHAKNISIAGAVRGSVFGKKVQLLRTGRVWGDISATALTTEEGAFIDGKISMVSHEASTSTQTSVSVTAAQPSEVVEEVDDAAEFPAAEEPDFLKQDEEPSS